MPARGRLSAHGTLVARSRTFVKRVTADDERFPVKALFVSDERHVDKKLLFKLGRWEFKAVMALFKDLILGRIDHLTKTAGELAATRDALRRASGTGDEVMAYLKHLGVENLEGTRQTIYYHLERGERVTTGLNKGSAARGQALHEWDALRQGAKAQAGRLADGEVTDRLTRIEQAKDSWAASVPKDYARTIQALKLSFGGVLETTNLALAYEAWKHATAHEKDATFRSLANSGNKFMAHMLNVAAALLEKGACRRLLTNVAAVAAVVAAAVDMLDFEQQALDAWVKHGDYSHAAGRGIQMLGAGMGAVGGAMVLTAEIFTLSAGFAFFGLVVGAVAAVLIIGGALLAEWLKDNINETFAKFCFLGDDHLAAPKQLPWTDKTLPTRDIGNEARILTELLATFRVGWGWDRRPSGLSVHQPTFIGKAIFIYPGLVNDTSVFQVAFTRHHSRPGGRFTHTAQLEVRVGEDAIVVMSANRPLEPRGNELVWSASGQLEYVAISLEYEGRVAELERQLGQPVSHELQLITETEPDVELDVRLLLDRSVAESTLPPDEYWLHYAWGQGQRTLPLVSSDQREHHKRRGK